MIYSFIQFTIPPTTKELVSFTINGTAYLFVWYRCVEGDVANPTTTVVGWVVKTVCDRFGLLDQADGVVLARQLPEASGSNCRGCYSLQETSIWNVLGCLCLTPFQCSLFLEIMKFLGYPIIKVKPIVFLPPTQKRSYLFRRGIYLNIPVNI